MSVSTIRRSVVKISKRCLHTSTPRQGSPFFALAALSNARETNHLTKLSKLSRVEHSPSLQLIQSSEVFPFARPPSPPVPQDTALETKTVDAIIEASATPKTVDGLSEADLLSVGRAILIEKNDEIAELRRTLTEERDRSMKREASYLVARQKARERIQQLSEDANSARRWKWFLMILGGSWLTWAYSQDSVKKAFDASSVKGIVSPRPQQPAVVQAKPVEKPPVVAPAPEPLPAVPVKASSPAKVLSTAETPAKSTSWPSIFWAKRE